MNLLKKIIVGTPLEKPSRWIVGLFRKNDLRSALSEWDLRAQRDEVNMDKILRTILILSSNCVDIGAHRGVFLRRFIELSPGGHHYAFEPLPELAAKPKEEYPTTQVFSCALGNKTDRVTFQFVPELSAWSGLKRQPYPIKVQPITIEVEIRRLDDVIPPEVCVTFIKIDVEGAELDVLRGAEQIIKRCKPVILFEHARIHNLEYETTPEMVYDFLVGECGLGVYSLDGSEPLTRCEFISIYNTSFASNYDRSGQTNFLANPVSTTTQ